MPWLFEHLSGPQLHLESLVFFTLSYLVLAPCSLREPRGKGNGHV